MILEFYRDCDAYPPLYDVYIKRDGRGLTINPPPEPLDGIKQVVLEGGAEAPTMAQRHTINRYIRETNWLPLFFFEIPELKAL